MENKNCDNFINCPPQILWQFFSLINIIYVPYPLKSWWTCDTICLLRLGHERLQLLPGSSGMLTLGMAYLGYTLLGLNITLWEAQITWRKTHWFSRWYFWFWPIPTQVSNKWMAIPATWVFPVDTLDFVGRNKLSSLFLTHTPDPQDHEDHNIFAILCH